MPQKSSAILNLASVKASLKLAWPISLQNILVTLLSMIDIMMVSHLGDAAVASVGLANRIQFVILVIVTGLGWGVGVLSSQYFGAGKLDKIRQSILMGISVGILVMIPIVILTFFYAGDTMALGTKDTLVISLGETYLWLTMPSLFFIAVIIVFENALRSAGHVKLPLALSASAIICNVILNFWLINGGLGIAALGVTGAAIATLISRLFHMLLLLLVLKKSKHFLKPTRADFPGLVNKNAWKKLLKLVWPMMFSFGVWSLGTFIYQLIYGQLGTKELAVMSVLAPIEGIFISVFLGFASACAIMVGQRLGASNFKEAWSIARTFAILAPLSGFVIGMLMLAGKPWLFMPFNNLPAETITLASEVFLLLCFGGWLKISNMTLSMGVLRAGGETKTSLYIDLIGMWLISIPLTAACAFYFSLPLFWVALAAYSEELAKVVLFAWRTYKRHWLKNLTQS
ncbi:MAG: MATE family efflux transporter [Thalassotalea sp.]